MNLLHTEYVYWLCGALLAACAWRELRTRRYAHAAFWAILAAIFLFGDAVKAATAQGHALPAQLAGTGVIALGLIAGSGRLRRAPVPDSAEQTELRVANAARMGHRLFLPALIIPFGTLAFTLLQPYLHFGGIADLGRADATAARARIRMRARDDRRVAPDPRTPDRGDRRNREAA